METPRANLKLEEAQFFLGHLREKQGKDARAFGFYLSAFLNAAYSMTDLLKREVKTDLKKGAVKKKQAKTKFDEWKQNWVNGLPADERKVWVLMEAQRRGEVHGLGAKTFAETKAVPLDRPSRGHPAFYGQMSIAPPAIFGDAWAEEKRKLGLPSWVQAWREAQIHHFKIEGERQDVVQTCERYVTLLQRLLKDFHCSELASKS